MTGRVDRLAQALSEASAYGIGATSDTNQRVILDAAKAFAAQPQSSADSTELEARLALADELMLPGGTHPYLGARKRAMIVAALRTRTEPLAFASSEYLRERIKAIVFTAMMTKAGAEYQPEQAQKVCTKQAYIATDAILVALSVRAVPQTASTLTRDGIARIIEQHVPHDEAVGMANAILALQHSQAVSDEAGS